MIVHVSSICFIATVFGRGVYFAKNASYSASDRYSPRDYITGCKHIFLAKVLTGEYVRGEDDYKVPPQRPSETDLYDSCVDNPNDPCVFVIFFDAQVYPEYLITFK